MLDVAERSMVEVADHVQRHTVQAGNFLNLKLSGFKELRLIIRNGNRRVLHVE